MTRQRILEGSWEEILLHSAELSGKQVKMIYPIDETDGQGTPIYFGMFPQLRGLTDKDFKGAEFHGDSDDSLHYCPS